MLIFCPLGAEDVKAQEIESSPDMEQMGKAAYMVVKYGTSLREASAVFGVTKSTLLDCAKRTKSSITSQESTDEAETELYQFTKKTEHSHQIFKLK